MEDERDDLPTVGVGAPGFPTGVGEEDLPIQAGESDDWSLPPAPAIQYPDWHKSPEFADLQGQYKRAESFWQADRLKMKVLYEDYVAWHDKKNYHYKSNLYIPKIYTAIRQIVARAQDAVLSVPHLCVIESLAIGQSVPGNLTVNERRAELCTWLMTELLRAANFNKTYTLELTLDAAIFGRAIGKIGWHCETKA